MVWPARIKSALLYRGPGAKKKTIGDSTFYVKCYGPSKQRDALN